MALRHKLILAFFFVVIIPITLLGMIIIELIITRSDESIANVVEHQLAMIEADHWRQAQQVQRGLVLLGEQFNVQRLILQNDGDALSRHLTEWQALYPQIDLWLAADTQGHIVSQTAATPPVNFDLSPFKRLLSKTLSTGQALTTTELLTEANSTQQYLAQMTIVPLGDMPAGAIIAIDRVDNNNLPVPPQIGLTYSSHTNEPSDFNPLIFITQHNEIVATSLPDQNFTELQTSELQESIALTVGTNWSFRGQAPTVQGVYQWAGEPIVDSNHQIIGSLFVGLPYRRYFGLQAQTGWIVTTMLIFSGIISLITASLIASAITQPIQNLIEKSVLLANGDLSVRASVSGRDEIAQLGYAFNKMAANLETSYEAIEQERQRALAIIEASADSIWVVNKQTDGSRRVTIVNSALEYMLGRQRHELVGQACSGLMGVCTPEGNSICKTSCPFSQPDKKRGIVLGVLPGTDGNQTPVEISYGRLTNRQGELTGLVHIMRDLTLRQEVERLKADFISMVSHELRTPLSHIKGFADTLLQPDVSWDAATQHDFLSSIDREVDRLTKLVENLLQMSRIEAGGLKGIERRLHQVDEFIELALPELRQRGNQHQLEIKLPSNAAALTVLIDARSLELVLVNLVENAAKYSPPHTKITFWVECDAQQVIFHIQDEGPGIALREQPHIFDRFYRVKTAGRSIHGTGLGLTICKEVIEAHEGRIWVTSTPGQSACFSFSLPICQTEECDRGCATATSNENVKQPAP